MWYVENIVPLNIWHLFLVVVRWCHGSRCPSPGDNYPTVLHVVVSANQLQHPLSHYKRFEVKAFVFMDAANMPLQSTVRLRTRSGYGSRQWPICINFILLMGVYIGVQFFRISMLLAASNWVLKHVAPMKLSHWIPNMQYNVYNLWKKQHGVECFMIHILQACTLLLSVCCMCSM